MNSISYNEEELERKLAQMIKFYEKSFTNLILVGYVKNDSLSFFLAENIMQYNKITTYKLNWDSGYMQDTFNLVDASLVYGDYAKNRISVVKEWMEQEYGKDVKQNLRGRWRIPGKNEDLKCDLTEEEIHEKALTRTYENAKKDIEKYLLELKNKGLI